MRLLVAVVVAVLTVAAPVRGNVQAPVERVYAAQGPWAVSERAGVGCCASSGAGYDVWYPTELRHAAVRHPIVTWGDGTSAVPSQYDYLLRHLASWGFVVIAAHNSDTGSGQDLIDAAKYLIRQNNTPSSIFYRALDPTGVAAVGHSQGATGAINALADSGGIVSTAVAFEIPAQMFCSSTVRCTDTRKLNSGSVFFVNGSGDSPISPSTQPIPWQDVGLQSDLAYYQATPEVVSKVWATAIGPSHNDVQGQPDCARASVPCVVGVGPYLGYPTAWLMDRLQYDQRAHTAFARGGEFYTAPGWTNQTGNPGSVG